MVAKSLGNGEINAMILNDSKIIELCKTKKMIEPFHPQQINTIGGQHQVKAISFGVSSFGYDIRAADEWRIFTNVNNTIVDPKAFDEQSFVEFQGNVCTAPPNSFILARSLEYIRMPRNVTGLMTNKSTYARCGLVSPITVLEAGWEGHITIEISNTTPLPARIYANEGIAQILFFEGSEPEVSYADRQGKYQGQVGVTVAKV